jgi:hypothetical protein
MSDGGLNAETKIGKGKTGEGTGAAQDWTTTAASSNPEQEEGPENRG